jgi:histidinol-phosphatase (PHP family)
MYADLHNHTTLCNHAEGQMYEYIERAIECGIDIFGFSDHAPMDFDRKYRMGFEDMRHYEKSIEELRKRYGESITIRTGYEVDWLPGYMDSRVLDADVDYLIGSVHFLDGWGFDNPEFIGRYEEEDIDDIWRLYFETVAQMVESALFDIVGHLDLIKVFGYRPRKDPMGYYEEILDTIASTSMVLEINSAGLRKPVAEAYPSPTIVKMAHERKIPISFASDAHSPEQVGYEMERIVSMAKEAGYGEAASFRDRKVEMYKI